MNKKVAQVFIRALGIVMLGSAVVSPVHANADPKMMQTTVKIINTKGQEIGTAQLTQFPDGVRMHIDAKNLPPGVHGIHFHETGKCDPPDFESAGAHLNPQHKQHGFKNPKGFHAGDLLNIQVKQDGTVSADLSSKFVTLESGTPNSLLKPGGTAIIIHEKADDYYTDPSGNSGKRIACAPIR